jgi:purine-nucleoside phosphorylase
MNQKLLEEASSYVTPFLKEIPSVAMILGSGLGDIADELEDRVFLEYKNIPGFPLSTAPGHISRLVFGYLNSVPIIIFQGRFHLYEGYTPEKIAFTIQFLERIGCDSLIITNASGAINFSYKPGDLMVIRDFLNFTGKIFETISAPYPNATEIFDKHMRETLFQAADNLNIRLQEGIYSSFTGPSFETPAEIRMLRLLGADVIGMSTILEIISARQCGLKVLGLSCISNMAAGILDQPITSVEVIEAGEKVKNILISLIREFLFLLKGSEL